MSYIEIRDRISEAAMFIRSRIGLAPEVALILGSGLGSLAEAVREPTVVPFGDIPHFPTATVPGHQGRLVFGLLGSRRVVVIQGRLHRYEGHSLADVVFPVTLSHALGASGLFVTNASGGIRPGFRPGTLMWITDHINWTGERLADESLIDGRFADRECYSRTRNAGENYSRDWLRQAEQRADELGIATRRGVYLWTRGPSYETRAEIRAFRKLGADAVGMSTVPEVEAARMAGMQVIGLSTITNLAAGLGSESLNHEEVMEAGRSVAKALKKLAHAVLETAPV